MLGNLANTVSLATGLPSINDQLGTRPLRWCLERYHPSSYLSLGVQGDKLKELPELYRVEPSANFDMFGNYQLGKRVHFYRLEPHSSAQGLGRDTNGDSTKKT